MMLMKVQSEANSTEGITGQCMQLTGETLCPSLFWLWISCPLSQSRPSLPVNRVFTLDLPSFHQRGRSERFERMVSEELFSQLIF